MRGRDFLAVSEFLRNLDGEASDRTRTGRAYYAAHLEARSYCEANFEYAVERSAREHADIPKLLTTIDNDLAVKLAILRGLRNDADYRLDLSPETILRQASAADEHCAEILARLDALSKESADESVDPT